MARGGVFEVAKRSLCRPRGPIDKCLKRWFYTGSISVK